MAKFLEKELREIQQVRITQSVDANGVFVTIPAAIIPALQEEQFFYIWTEKTSEARLMCSFDTSEEDVRKFVAKLRRLVNT